MSQPGPIEFVEQSPEELNSELEARHELWTEHQLADGSIRYLEPEPFRVVWTDSCSVGIQSHVRRSNYCSIFSIWNSHIQLGVIKQSSLVHLLQGVETR